MILSQILLFIHPKLIDFIDILLVAILLYQIYYFIRGTVAFNILLGILLLYLIWALVSAMEMVMLESILGEFINIGVIVLVIVFQKEIRQFLFLLGKSDVIRRSSKAIMSFGRQVEDATTLNVEPIINASESMAKSYTGALIVVANENELPTFIETGVKMDAITSSQLIESIFYKNSPLHDGAIIISDNRIIAARCILPVSENTKIPESLGLRHRAALGLSEVSDAISIIVSEQTGAISCCIDGELKFNIKPIDLKRLILERIKKN